MDRHIHAVSSHVGSRADEVCDNSLSALSPLIGCAGWSISSRFAQDFPEQGTHLERYASVFNAVEINSSFYRSHRHQTYVRWRDSVPRAFRFSVKIPRTITHFQRLHDAKNLLEQFAEESSGLQEKLGCVLIQMPPSLSFEESVATQFLALVQRLFPCMIACEARHPSWFGSVTTALLTDLGMTRVIADPPAGQHNPHVATSRNIYRRLHGSPKMYYSAYGQEYLTHLASDISDNLNPGNEQWCIFDNTAEGAATADALLLRSILIRK